MWYLCFKSANIYAWDSDACRRAMACVFYGSSCQWHGLYIIGIVLNEANLVIYACWIKVRLVTLLTMLIGLWSWSIAMLATIDLR